MTERERFEAWARQRWAHPEDFDQRIKAPSKYNNYEVQAAWEAWQERAAQNAPSVVEVTDAMALAFHHALTDGSIGAQEVEEIKDALRAALAAAPEAKP